MTRTRQANRSCNNTDGGCVLGKVVKGCGRGCGGVGHAGPARGLLLLHMSVCFAHVCAYWRRQTTNQKVPMSSV